jgi:hypothetical protein
MTTAQVLNPGLHFKTRDALQLDTSWSELERAIVLTVAYADVFDYPLTSGEIHRYLAGVAAEPAAVEAALRQRHLSSGALAQAGPYVMLPGREAIVETRRRRAAVAATMWSPAVRYGRMIGRLPFVRMVAVTGALAVSNVDAGADIDYLIITAPGRLWLCRAIIIALVRLAAQRGHILCPNYLLSERALALSEHSLYGAHELMQMVPITGLPWYHRMRRANAWADELLPNAPGLPYLVTPQAAARSRTQALAELALRSPAGAWLERWEMERKVRKFSVRHPGNPEISLNSDCCKGHFDGHGQRTLAAYADRVRTLVK